MANWGLFNYFIVVCLLLVFGFYVSIGYFWLSYIYKRTQKRKEEFYETLINALKIGTIASINDVINIYNGLNGGNVSNGNYKLSNFLKGFLVKIQSVGLDATKEEVKSWKMLITELVTQNQETSPFEELPNSERNIMNDILSYLNSDDKESIKRKMKELAVFILTRKEYLDKIEKQNKLSIPLAVIGLILTIVFGIASIVFGIASLK